MPTFETNDVIVKFNDSEAVRDKMFERVLKYFKEHEVFHGESIHQMDDSIIDAPNVMSDIADKIIKFKVTSKD
jgi:hypothetical protein